ncbi:MAG: pyridoxal phosphate-dependent decarboxylase family protein [Ilumatobacteraceae bacterium]
MVVESGWFAEVRRGFGPAWSDEEIDLALQELAADDVRWKEGRVFSLAYDAGPRVRSVAERAHAAFSSANGLNTDAFPSLRAMQSEVIAVVQGWVRAPDGAAGFMTSGGTESILMAVKAARERGRVERGISNPNMVLPTSAHAAFEKAAHYFGLESRRAEVAADWRADVKAMSDLVDDDTVLLVGSAPQYPQGVIDPIPEIAALGLTHDVNVHVDACMGGVTLPYLERLGEPVPAWDFRVEGVTSISVDLHKYGYTAKGASVVVYRDKKQRSYQTFVTDNWLGGVYGSSGILGTKSGGPIAAAWAVMHAIGDDGYERLTSVARRTALHLAEAISAVPELELRARPDSTLVSFGIRDGSAVDGVAEELRRRGWYVDRQGPPPALHCTVHAGHADTIDDFIVDLQAAAGVRSPDAGGRGRYGTIE